MESATETQVFARELTIAARPGDGLEAARRSGEAVGLVGHGARVRSGTGRPIPGRGHPRAHRERRVRRGRRTDAARLHVGLGGQGDEGVPPGSTTVEISLAAEDDGTKLTFVHRDLPTEASRDSHAFGWDNYLGRLATVAEGGDPGRDPFLDSM